MQAAIRAGRLGPPAADNARTIYGYLERSGADAEQLAAAKDQISTAYARQAGELRSKGSFGDARKVTYYTGHETIIASGSRPGMARWREQLFAFMHHNAQRPGAYFKIPSAQVMEIGIEFEM